MSELAARRRSGRGSRFTMTGERRRADLGVMTR